MCAMGSRPSHYALSLLAAAAGAAFATRQILLHILPGDPGYGTALLGYHYYTWALIGLCRRDPADFGRCCCSTGSSRRGIHRSITAGFASLAVWLVIGLVALNVVSTLLQCGFSTAPTIRWPTRC